MGILFIQVGIVSAGLSVILGAFAAHALKSKISSDMLSIFEVGVRYQMYHSLALILLGVLMFHLSNIWLQWTGWSFIGGILLFSGSLYVLSLSGVRAWGAVTPVGGILFLIGWMLFGIGVLRN